MYAIYVNGEKMSFVYTKRQRALALLHYWRRERLANSQKFGSPMVAMTLEKVA